MEISKFDYWLPKKLIAQTPANPRDHSRLMVIDRNHGAISNHIFYEIADMLSKNDVLVLNNTKVFPARFYAQKDTGGKVEILLTEEVKKDVWKALTKPGLKLGQKLNFNGAKFIVVGNEDQTVLIKSDISKIKLLDLLQDFGHTPLPPYIKSSESEARLREKYQTVYAKSKGSVAAPTAGFHFTNHLLQKLIKKGVQVEYVTLHVGLGTFLPVKTKKLEDRKMHFEYFEAKKDVLDRLNIAKSEGKRIIAVGTTTARVLESVAIENGKLKIENQKGTTNLFVYPPYKFKFIDALITNFHLPQSTLLALVSAFVSFPNTNKKFKDFKSSLMGKAYLKAIEQKYRFYSFGDVCLIL